MLLHNNNMCLFSRHQNQWNFTFTLIIPPIKASSIFAPCQPQTQSSQTSAPIYTPAFSTAGNGGKQRPWPYSTQQPTILYGQTPEKVGKVAATRKTQAAAHEFFANMHFFFPFESSRPTLAWYKKNNAAAEKIDVTPAPVLPQPPPRARPCQGRWQTCWRSIGNTVAHIWCRKQVVWIN